MQSFFSSPRLVTVAAKSQLLTLKLDLDTLAEFAVAARVFRARSVASFLHSYVVGQINAAKKEVSVEEFQRMVQEQKRETLARSKAKSLASPLNSERLVNEKIVGIGKARIDRARNLGTMTDETKKVKSKKTA